MSSKPKGKRIGSRSDVQKAVEEKIVESIRKDFEDFSIEANVKLVISGTDTYICPDFYSSKGNIIGEIHTHLGRLKGSQTDKIASDILKMLLWEKVTGKEYKKYIYVCNNEELAQLQGKSALAVAIRQYGIRLRLYELGEDDAKKLESAMRRQNLVIKKDVK